jgi:integrase
MRIGEVVRVKLSDVDLSPRPAEIVVRGEYAKTGDTRTVFISSEAKEALTEWLKVRDKYLIAAQNRNKGLVAKGPARRRRERTTACFLSVIRTSGRCGITR